MSKSLGLIDVLFLLVLVLASTVPVPQAPRSGGEALDRVGMHQHLGARKLAVNGPLDPLAKTMSL